MESQEDLVLPGSWNPHFSLFPASLSHDRVDWIIESLSRWRIGREAIPAFTIRGVEEESHGQITEVQWVSGD